MKGANVNEENKKNPYLINHTGFGGYDAPKPAEPLDHSISIGKIALALAKCQGMMKAAVKNEENPFFKKSYADLSSVWEAIREPMAKNELAVTQLAGCDEGNVTVTTLLMHSSGEWIRGRLVMRPVKADPQGVGSCLTYARRYAISSIMGVCPDDDDGNEATTAPTKKAYQNPRPPAKKANPYKKPFPGSKEPPKVKDDTPSDLQCRRMAVFNELIGKGKKFGSQVLDAKAWVKEITDGEMMNLTEDQCQMVEDALGKEEANAS